MNMSKLTQRVEEEIASNFGIEPDSINPQTRLLDLSSQPIKIKSLVTAFRKKFELDIEEKELKKAVTVQDVIDQVVFSL